MLLTAFFVALLLAWAFLKFLKRRNSRSHLPPGPPANPFLGHLLVIPRLNQEVVFYHWGKQYGKACLTTKSLQLIISRGCYTSQRSWKFFGSLE